MKNPIQYTFLEATPSQEEIDSLNSLLKQISENSKQLTRQSANNFLSHGGLMIMARNRESKTIIGFATIVLSVKINGTTGRIEHVVVDERYRGKGISLMIMKFLIDAARRNGTSRLDLTSSPARIAANVLYQKLGFEKRDTNVYRLELQTVA